MVTDGLLETPDGALAMAAGLYGNIRWHFGYEWAYGITLYGADEFTNGADLTSEPWNTYDTRLNPMDCTVATGAANNNCPGVSALWNEMYYGISTANLVIDKAVKVADEDSRNKALGEAYFCEAITTIVYLLSTEVLFFKLNRWMESFVVLNVHQQKRL